MSGLLGGNEDNYGGFLEVPKKPVAIWVLLIISFAVVYAGRSLSPHTQIILFLLPSFFIGNLAYLYRNILLKVHPFVPWIFLLMVINSSRIPYFNQLFQLSPVGFQAFAVVWVGLAGAKIIPFKFPDISYGVYIFHMPLIIYLIQKNLAVSTVEMAMWLPVPLIINCLLSWYLVERPALQRKRLLKDQSQVYPPGAIFVNAQG